MTSPATLLPALRQRPLLVVANRGPYDFSAPSESGELRATRSQSGGVVTALEAMTRLAANANPGQPPIWVSIAGKEIERRFAREDGVDGQRAAEVLSGDGVRVNYVPVGDDVYHRYYNMLANPLLWFVQHGIWSAPNPMPEFDVQAWRAYQEVNNAVADRVVRLTAAQRQPVVSLQDYHFYLAAGLIRRQLPNVTLQQFIHIPWPTPQQWGLLPLEVVNQIVTGLLGNDILGFQTKADATNFRELCRDLGYTLPGLGDIRIGNRTVAVRDYPIGIDVEGYTEKLHHFYTWKHYRTLGNWLGADTSEVRQFQQWTPFLEAKKHLELRTSGDPLITMMGRIDPSKNLVGGLLAYERMLEKIGAETGSHRPRLFLFGQETRTDIAEYQRYFRSTNMNANRINARFLRYDRGDDWHPVRFHVGQDVHLALALYMLADVTVIPSLADGMNLMALESRAFGSSTLLLSRQAGAFQSVGRWSLGLDPENLEQMAGQMETAFSMPASQRQQMADSGRRYVMGHDLDAWIARQMRDVAAMGEQQRGLG